MWRISDMWRILHFLLYQVLLSQPDHSDTVETLIFFSTILEFFTKFKATYYTYNCCLMQYYDLSTSPMRDVISFTDYILIYCGH